MLASEKALAALATQPTRKQKSAITEGQGRGRGGGGGPHIWGDPYFQQKKGDFLNLGIKNSPRSGLAT